jgi:hypothetical protein
MKGADLMSTRKQLASLVMQRLTEQSSDPRKLRLFACACVRLIQEWQSEGKLKKEVRPRRPGGELAPDAITDRDALIALERLADAEFAEDAMDEVEAIGAAIEKSWALENRVYHALAAASNCYPKDAARAAALVIEAALDVSPEVHRLAGVASDAAQRAVEEAYGWDDEEEDERQRDKRPNHPSWDIAWAWTTTGSLPGRMNAAS